MKRSKMTWWRGVAWVAVALFLDGLAPILAQNPGPVPAPGPVKVEIYEDLTSPAELSLDDATRTEIYTENAFGLIRIPTKYSANALPLDRSNPFALRASFTTNLPAGEYQFRLRAKGLANFQIDGKILASTHAQKGNTAGHDPVPPPVERGDTALRPAQYPHQEKLVTVTLDGQSHEFTLIALIGSKGLVPSPGELTLSFNQPGRLAQLLGLPGTPLTDEAWEPYAAACQLRHKQLDNIRRHELSIGTVAAWSSYHEKVRKAIGRKPAPEPPRVSTLSPVLNPIDQFIGARLEAAKTSPTPLTSDLDFLRRLSLDAVGLIPSPEEVRRFMDDPPAERRQKAIDRLLANPGWADHWVSYWQDVLAENPGFLKPDLNNSGPFRWWLHQAFTDNLPFDRLAAELIEMEGSPLGGGPAGFKMATLNDAPMAAKADILSQAFLAEKLSCARCHDAPDHPHKQIDTFSLAAMLDGKPVKLPKSSTVPFVEGFRKPKVVASLKPGEEISGHWPFDKLVEGNELAQLVPVSDTAPRTRSEVASKVVSPDNTRFARVIVNRVWKRYMGAGLVEPVEDWQFGKPSHPELLDWLAREFMLGGYDLKALARTIFSSHAYQRQPVTISLTLAKPEDRLFTGPERRRLSAEQLVDSLFRCAGKSFGCEEMNLNPVGDRPLTEFLNLGTPQRAWEFTALMNERDRPALALPIAQSIVDVLTTFGWRQSRQNPVTVRQDTASPMQTLLLANGVVGTRIARLSDDSAFTELALRDQPVDDLVRQTFMRVLSRPPSASEGAKAQQFLQPVYGGRQQEGIARASLATAKDTRVSWGNHLSAEATLIRMDEERQLRMGDPPSPRLKPEFRERYEDLIWSLVNAPEFMLVP